MFERIRGSQRSASCVWLASHLSCSLDPRGLPGARVVGTRHHPDEGADAAPQQEAGDRERPDEALRAHESSPAACSAASSAARPASVIRYMRGESVVICT